MDPYTEAQKRIDERERRLWEKIIGAGVADDVRELLTLPNKPCEKDTSQ